MGFKPGSPELKLVLTVGDLRKMIATLPDDMPVRISGDMGNSSWAEKESSYEDVIGYAGRMMDVLVIGVDDRF